MDFDLSPEQLALRATVRDLFADHYDSIEQRNAVSSTDLGWSESLWRCLLYTSPSPRDGLLSRMPSSA